VLVGIHIASSGFMGLETPASCFQVPAVFHVPSLIHKLAQRFAVRLKTDPLVFLEFHKSRIARCFDVLLKCGAKERRLIVIDVESRWFAPIVMVESACRSAVGVACQEIKSVVDLIVEVHVPDTGATAEMRIQWIELASLPMELMPWVKTSTGISRSVVVTEVIVARSGTYPQIPGQPIHRNDHLWCEPTGSIPVCGTPKPIWGE